MVSELLKCLHADAMGMRLTLANAMELVQLARGKVRFDSINP